MNVLLASDIPLGVPSASRNRLFHMAQALRKSGVKVVICGTGAHTSHGFSETTLNGFSVVCYSDSNFDGGWAPAMQKANAASKFYEQYSAQLFACYEIQICLARFNTSRPFASIQDSAKSTGVLVVADLVECYMPSLRMLINGVWLEQRRLVREILPKLDGVVGITHFWTQLAEQHKVPHVWIPSFAVPSAVSGALPAKASGQPFKILFLGHWVKRENPITILRAIARCLSLGHNVEVNVLGRVGESFWERKAINYMRRNRQLHDHVHFHGYVSDPTRDQLLAEADAFIILRSENRETAALFPTRLPEYLLSGNPVILSRAGEFPRCFTHRADIWFIGAENRPTELADAIIHLINNPDERAKIGAAGRASAVRLFSTDVLAPRLTQFLQGIINNRRGSPVSN